MRCHWSRFVGFAVLSATTLVGQVRSVTIQGAHASTVPSNSTPSGVEAKSKMTISVPTVGFLINASGDGLIPIRGFASAPMLGQTVPKPDGVSQIFLPPRQRYALVEDGSSNAISVWHVGRQQSNAAKDAIDAIPGALQKPDLVAFSPNGTAAVLFGSPGRLQVVTGLPNVPVLKAEIEAVALDHPTTIAVSDDGQLVLTVDSTGQIRLCSDGKNLREMPWPYAPVALTFVPKTHNLVISDSQQKQTILLRDAGPASAPVVVGSALQPNYLAGTSDGEVVVALDAGHQKLYEINASTLAVTPILMDYEAQTLVTLRDGHTFLLSTAPFALLKVADALSSPVIHASANQ